MNESQTDNEFQCDRCFEVMESRMKLLAHRRACKSTCVFCRRTFKNRSALLGHIKTHNKKKEEKESESSGDTCESSEDGSIDDNDHYDTADDTDYEDVPPDHDALYDTFAKRDEERYRKLRDGLNKFHTETSLKMKSLLKKSTETEEGDMINSSSEVEDEEDDEYISESDDLEEYDKDEKLKFHGNAPTPPKYSAEFFRRLKVPDLSISEPSTSDGRPEKRRRLDIPSSTSTGGLTKQTCRGKTNRKCLDSESESD